METLTVLSLFDGMSCGQIALRELCVPIERYYASEIDKHAIAQTQLNFPDTIQLGDVEQWRTWETSCLLDRPVRALASLAVNLA